MPNLEIETGLIEGAGHASTTGQLDEQHLWYLQARGIPEAEATPSGRARLPERDYSADFVFPNLKSSSPRPLRQSSPSATTKLYQEKSMSTLEIKDLHVSVILDDETTKPISSKGR